MTSEFEKIRRSLLKSGEVFEDADFPCVQSSVFYHETPPFNFSWKRPFEICSNPQFLPPTPSPSSSSFDSIISKLGDPWFVSSISLLYLTKGLFYRVVPADQSFESEEYAGIFRFRVWWFGQWHEVVIDDRLPCHPVNDKLVFINAINGNIFWPCLLEKAFAKLHGSYEALKYGTTLESLSDLTGGVTEGIDLRSEDALSCRLLIQRLLNITSIVTAVLSPDDSASSTTSHSSMSPSSPPQFLYPSVPNPSSSSSPLNGKNHQHHRHHNKSQSSSSNSSSSEVSPFPSITQSHRVTRKTERNSDGRVSSSSSSPSSTPSREDKKSSSSSSPFPRSPSGIVASVNYRITGMERVETLGDRRDQVFLLRMVNPLSTRAEYLGPYGNKLCPRWTQISDQDRLRLESFEDEDSGDFLDEIPFDSHKSRGVSGGGVGSRKGRSKNAFWMEWNDFKRIFSHLEVVFLDGETSRDEPSLARNGKFPMTVKLYRGIWRKGCSAGGCRNNSDTFHLNPQIELSLSMDSDDMTVICLNQHSVLEPQVVGFSIYSCGPSKTPLTDGRLGREFFKKNKSLMNSSYSNSRQVLLRCCLDRGSYVLLPTSFEPGYEGSFSLRVYSMKGVRLRLLDGENVLVKNPILKSPSSFDSKFTQYEMMFMQVADEHKSVNCFDLQELLESSLPNDYVKSCATTEVCRLIISALDTMGTGRIHIRDYKNIMCSLRFWQNTFKNHTKGTTGILRIEKLEESLSEVGFKLSSDVLSSLVLKYMRKDSTLRFGDFVAAILHLTISFRAFEKQSKIHQPPQHKSNVPLHNSHHHLHHHQENGSNTLSVSLLLNDWLKVSLQT